MPSLSLYNQSGDVIGEVQPLARLYDEEINVDLLHQVVVAYLANRRSGTASTKSRNEVKGSGRKLYSQKHTGRARAGDIKSPLRVGGGIVFGPKPRSYRQDTPKKMRRKALLHSIADKFQCGNVVVVDEIKLDAPKTKTIVGILRDLNLTGKVIIVLDSYDRNVCLASRNIPGVSAEVIDNLNAYQVMWHDKMVITSDALEKLGVMFGVDPGETPEAPVKDSDMSLPLEEVVES